MAGGAGQARRTRADGVGRSRTRSRRTTRSCARRCSPASSTPPAATSPAASPTSRCSRSARSSRRAADAKELPASRRSPPASWSGAAPEWLKPGAPVDFFDAKRIAASCCARSASTSPATASPAARPDRCTPGVAAGSSDRSGPGAGRLVGEVHPAPRERSASTHGALYFEVELDAIAGERRSRSQRVAAALPRGRRATSRSGSTPTVTADEQRAALTAAAEPLLRELAVLEDYRDPRYAPPGKKGMLWTLIYRADDRTLTDAEVDAAHARDRRGARSAAPSIVDPLEDRLAGEGGSTNSLTRRLIRDIERRS